MFHRVLVLVWCLCCWGALAENSTVPYSLRLVRGHSRCQGELQVQRRGQDWIDVIPWSVPLWFGDRVCAAVDCGSVLSVEKKNVAGRDAVGPVNPWIDPLLDDPFGSDVRRSNGNLVVNCSDSVRFASGRTCSGLLQIRDQSLDQSWTPVCEGDLDRRGAEVLCRELGCGPPRLQGALPPLGQMFHCEGHESGLMDCPRNQTRTEPGTCSPLHLTCSEPLRLVGGASRCEGTVELKYRGEWRRVVPIYFPGDLGAAAAVCRDLDCGSLVSAAEKRGLNSTEVWEIVKECVKTAAVKECVYESSRSDEGLEVVCSGHQRAP